MKLNAHVYLSLGAINIISLPYTLPSHLSVPPLPTKKYLWFENFNTLLNLALLPYLQFHWKLRLVGHSHTYLLSGITSPSSLTNNYQFIVSSPLSLLIYLLLVKKVPLLDATTITTHVVQIHDLTWSLLMCHIMNQTSLLFTDIYKQDMPLLCCI